MFSLGSVDVAYSSVCKETEDWASKKLDTAQSTVTIEVSLCELQEDYSDKHFPAFYWKLNKAYQQPSTQLDLVDNSLTWAKQSIVARESDTAEKIYQITLNHSPKEPRVLSSYAALMLNLENYEKGLELLDQALLYEKNDPMIVHNRFLVAVMFGNYEDASRFNTALRKLEPTREEHILRAALLDRLHHKNPAADSWDLLLSTQTNENNRAYWLEFTKLLEDRKYEDLMQAANQWVDIRMSYEALILLDYVISQTTNPLGHYIKAKAYEFKKHYKLAYQSVKKAKELALSSSEFKDKYYKHALFESGRLAYAIKHYNESLALLDEYANKGYTHPNLDYMYAVSYKESNQFDKAMPYFQKCATQKLADNLEEFCKAQLGNVTARAKAMSSKQDDTGRQLEEKKNTEIEIQSTGIQPNAYMQGITASQAVSWLGEIIDTKFTLNGGKLHVRWTARFLQPKDSINIVDDKDYKIKFNDATEEQLFVVNMYVNVTNQENVENLKKNVTQETHIVVEGDAIDVQAINEKLAAVVEMRRAVFTSRISRVE